jgi:hypothetical protein
LAVVVALAAVVSPLFAKDDPNIFTAQLDDAWVERALANPERDQGWSQSSNSEWDDGRVANCEVRRFTFPRNRKLIAIDGGRNSGMSVMGWDRDSVRVLYRVMTRARTEERARALAAEIQLELANGWLRPDGPETSRSEWWSIDVKAWVPRASDVALQTENGPMSVRDVRGRMDLNSSNGPMSLVDLAGAVQAHTENGPLYVALAGSRWDGAGIDAEAENGPVTLELPANYSARLVTGTINGPQAFDYAIESGRRRGWITTTLGKGGPQVRVVTTNGPFQIGER